MTLERKVSLTQRDLNLLRELYKNTVLSFPQVERKVFRGRAKSTIINRLGRLEGLGVITRWRVPLLERSAPTGGAAVVYQITRRGIGVLKRVPGARVLRDKPVRLSGYSLYHDVLLVDVMDALRARFPGAHVTHGRLIEQGNGEHSVPDPDAVLTVPGGGERWGIELELHAKSEARYRELVLRYRLARDLERVLYVSGASDIVPKLARVLERPVESLGASHPQGKFLFVPLDVLLNEWKRTQSPLNVVTQSNLKGEISL